MSNLTPFEIRLELLKMAKELLLEDYTSNKERLINEWHVKVESAKLNGQTIPDHPDFPTYPSETDIINKAQALNGFVSNITAEKTQSKKSA
jgi:proteasome lid subunit RPN8/RPN11